MAALQDELQPLLARYEAEKGQVDEQQRLQNKVCVYVCMCVWLGVGCVLVWGRLRGRTD